MKGRNHSSAIFVMSAFHINVAWTSTSIPYMKRGNCCLSFSLQNQPKIPFLLPPSLPYREDISVFLTTWEIKPNLTTFSGSFYKVFLSCLSCLLDRKPNLTTCICNAYQHAAKYLHQFWLTSFLLVHLVNKKLCKLTVLPPYVKY